MAFIESRRLRRKLLSIGALAGLILLLAAAVVFTAKLCGLQKPDGIEAEPTLQIFVSETPAQAPNETERITAYPTNIEVTSAVPEPTPVQTEAPKPTGRGNAVMYVDVRYGVSADGDEFVVVATRVAMRFFNNTEKDMYAAQFYVPEGCRIINASVNGVAARFDISETYVLGIPFLHELKPNEGINVFFELVWEGATVDQLVLPHPSDDAEYGLSSYVSSDRELFFSLECEALEQDEGFLYRFDHLGINKLIMMFKEEA